MSMVFVLLPLSIILGGGALVLFLWALRNGQFDDLETPAHRILFEDEQVTEQHHCRYLRFGFVRVRFLEFPISD